MLKMIIADDEEIERIGLKRNLPWSELGIELIGTYENGKDAFEAICTEVPDILLTDIRMPVMDGLELAGKVRGCFSNVKIVFLSGYDDFNYAKKAIDLNACRYILKPFEKDELIEIIREIAVKCEEEKRNEFEQQNLKQKLAESLPLLKEKFYTDLLSGVYEDEEIIKKRVEFLGVPLPIEGTYIVDLIEIDNFCSLVEKNGESYVKVFPVYFCEMVRRCISDYTEICIILSEAVYAVIFPFSDKNSAFSTNYTLMDKLQKEINRYFKTSITIGIGKQCHLLRSIANSYKQSKEAAKYKFIVGLNQIIYYDDIGERDILELDGIVESSKNKLVSALSIGNIDGVNGQIDIIYDALLDKKIDTQYIQNISIDIINSVSKVVLRYNIDVEAIFGAEVNLIGKLLGFDTIFDIRLRMKDMLMVITEHIRSRCSSKNRKVIEKITDIIQKRYAEDLAVADIVSEVFLSAGYASSLFKKETGESITDYLIRTRIEKAKQMLSTPGIKVYEVSEQVGYSNYAYFSALFKKMEGISPKEYNERFGKY